MIETKCDNGNILVCYDREWLIWFLNFSESYADKLKNTEKVAAWRIGCENKCRKIHMWKRNRRRLRSSRREERLFMSFTIKCPYCGTLNQISVQNGSKHCKNPACDRWIYVHDGKSKRK